VPVRQEVDMPGLEAIAKVLFVLPDSMVLVDSLGVIVLANAQACKMFGYDLDALNGKPIASLVPERSRAIHQRDVEGYFRSPSVRTAGAGMELSARRADGSEFPVEISLSHYHEGDAVYALASIRDITERKNLEEVQRELRRQKAIAEERARAAQMFASRNDALRAIFEASPLGMVTATQDGIIDRWNRAAGAIYGYPASEVLGRSIWEMTRLTDVETNQSAAAVDIENQVVNEVRDFRTRGRRKDGKIIDISLSSARYDEVNGRNYGFVFLSDDISERTMMEQQLRQAQKMEAVGQLTGGVAHDFNNLLSVIICSLELLREKLPADEEHVELTETALTAALHGADLVKQILAFSRKQNLQAKRLDVNQVLRDMSSLLARSLGEQVEIVLQPSDQLWQTIADPVQLQTALVNLATNARDAMPEGGRLVIQTENSFLDEAYVEQFVDLNAGEYVVVSVSDSGHGMEPETVERAFDPFFTTKPMGVGTGLGLSMVFGFVKQSGGHIRLYSEVGHGTTARLYLPRAAQDAPESMPAARPALQQYRPSGARVLIVEDNVALAKSAHRLLSDAGYQATVATNAEEALTLLRDQEPFDVLFTDIVLSHGENGIELAREAAILNPKLRVLFSSGFAESVLRQSGKVAVEGNFIAKPYRKEDLIARIESLMAEEQA